VANKHSVQPESKRWKKVAARYYKIRKEQPELTEKEAYDKETENQ